MNSYRSRDTIIAVVCLLMLVFGALSYFDIIGPENPTTPPVQPPSVSDFVPNIEDDDSFTWFPTEDAVVKTVKVKGDPYPVEGPIVYVPTDPDTSMIDSLRGQLIALKDYINRQYIFRIRYAEPHLQMSLISMANVSEDTVKPVYTLQEYTLPPAFEVTPTLGGYKVSALELDKDLVPDAEPPLFTYKTWAGLGLIQADMPMSAFVRQEAYYKKSYGSLELNLNADANVTARLTIGVQVR
jgi:hypothetical protein